MKIKKIMTRILIVMLVLILGLGVTQNLAYQDYQEDDALELSLSYFRYVNGEIKDGYALNTVGNEGESHHPIFQIMSQDYKTNYYCLNATAGESWISGTIGTNATYNRSYDLSSASDLELLKNETDEVYSNIANSEYLSQILWILDNIYIPDSNATTEENLAQKQEILAKAGIVFGDVDDENLEGVVSQGYRYIAQPEYDYSEKVSVQGKKGWFYYDPSSEYHYIELSDEMVEVAQQAALWYFTNYLENNDENSETYNVKDQWLQLLCSNGQDETDTNQWPVLSGETFKEETDVEDYFADVGAWRQEQASILCEYLIDAANNYAMNSTDEDTTGNPLSITPEIANINEKTVDDSNYYVVGPMKIDEQREVVYELSDTITINGSTDTGAYISDVDGNRQSDQTVRNYVGQEFYIAIPVSSITGEEIKIDFEGTYKTNRKTLWISTTKTEQPVVEVDPEDDPIELTVTATIEKEEEIKEFDLALQKYISSIYSKGTTREGRQEPTIDTSKLADGTETTATYTQDKTPIKVKQGDYVTYTFTVYNEGEIAGYVNKITDNIPEGLQFVYPKQPADGKTLIVCDSKGNSEEIEADEETYELVSKNNSYWSIDSSEGNLTTDTYNGEETISISCDVESYLEGTNKLLQAYDSSKDNNNDGAGLDRVSVTVVLKVEAANESGVVIRNEAAITEAEDQDGNKQDASELIDRDSQVNEWPGKDGDKNYQDDEDYDNIILGKVDLALTKFITAVSEDLNIEEGEYLTEDGKVGSDTNPYIRATKVDTTELRDNEECHDATYIMVKDPLTVPAESYVLYNIRVYNEGEVDVYAGEVTDYLPEYLDYVDCDFNKQYGWNVESDGKTISTSYLSYEKGETNLLKAFDKETDNGEGSGLDYRDIQVLCKVNDKAPTNTNIVNIAEITKYEDEEGEDIPNDVDSTPDNVDVENEDDDDYEVILVKTFDLSLLKYVTTVYVTEDGVTKTTQTGNTGNDNTDIIPKVEIHRKKIDSTIVKFGYTIKVTNEGDIAGYAKEITDYVPEGLKFYAEDNKGWTDEGNNVISTKLLEDKLLQPGESAEVTVVLRWINSSNNLGYKTNIAEISEDYNEEDIPDKDSTPDNKKEGEDDIDDAQVVLSISTGLTDNIIMYVTTGTIILVVLATGIILIKKYVL